jgi:hypothetical protein
VFISICDVKAIEGGDMECFVLDETRSNILKKIQTMERKHRLTPFFFFFHSIWFHSINLIYLLKLGINLSVIHIIFDCFIK